MNSSIEIKIAIIGPKERVNLIKDVLRDFPNISPSFIELNDLLAYQDQIESLSTSVESLLFTDYYMCQ